MFRSPTVFVVGAGASRQFGLPMSKELTDRIASILRFERGPSFMGDEVLAQAIDTASHGQVDEFFATAAKMSVAIRLWDSIDTYLDVERDNPQISIIGKLAIAKVLLDAESNSCVNFAKAGSNLAYWVNEPLRSAWHGALCRMIMAGFSKSDRAKAFGQISFIVFNYDRCLEEYLYRALQVGQGLSEAETIETLNQVNFIHPYGIVGRLPWRLTADAMIPFGEKVTSSQLIKVAAGLRTFTEREKSPAFQNDVRMLMAGTLQIVFLGFSYQTQNMQLLANAGSDYRSLRILGTVKGISKDNIVFIRGSIASSYNLFGGAASPSIELANLDCETLLSDYAMRLIS